MVNVAIMGYGTVGSGVYEVLEENKNIITERTGEEINVKYVLDIREFPGDPVEKVLIHDFETLLNDEEIKVAIEVMGGTGVAYKFVKSCLLAGKSVVTSNKALVAAYGAELLAIAKEKGVNFLFEASVGGGIPIIRPLRDSMSGDYIEEISGILNGTTNYMMTKMFNEGAEYDAVLKEAQAKGYAEANPTADVEGHDACRKIAILSSIITGKMVDFEKIHCEGISKVTAQDMKYAKAMGRRIKLLASCNLSHDGRIQTMVAPRLVAPEHLLYNVNDVFNAVFVHGNMLGDALFYGSGAGKLPTASAVVGDIVRAVRHPDRDCMTSWSTEELVPEDKNIAARRFFIRMQGDKEAMAAGLEEALGQIEIITVPELEGEFGVVTGRIPEGQFEQIVASYGEQVLQTLRVEEVFEENIV
ncbi:MAG: homoserine dehydrogenase [Dorea sp.]|nr:homoserine dehydrogenase [Dorea sp.]